MFPNNSLAQIFSDTQTFISSLEITHKMIFYMILKKYIALFHTILLKEEDQQTKKQKGARGENSGELLLNGLRFWCD